MRPGYSFDRIGDEAYSVLLGTLRTCLVMLLCSLAILWQIGEVEPRTYRLYRLAAELESGSAGVLLWGNAAALLLERFRRR